MTSSCPSRRTFITRGCGLLAAGGALGAGSASLQAQPAAATVHFLCSGPPGSIPDIVARRVAEQWAARAAQAVVVDNRPGAAGRLAVAALKNGPADGNTLLLAQGAIATVYPYLYPQLGYDPVGDLQPVSLAGEMTLALAVGPAVPDSVTDLRGLLAWLRREPGLANVGSPGAGTLPHLLAAMLMREAGLPWQHIAYPGGPPGLVALLGGQIAAMVLPEGLFLQHKLSGRLRVLATSGSVRTAMLPDVPTLAELGYPGLVVREWFGFFAAGRVAPALVDSASATLRAALAQPALVAAFQDAGMVAVAATPAAMASRIAAEQRGWQPLLRSLGVQVE